MCRSNFDLRAPYDENLLKVFYMIFLILFSYTLLFEIEDSNKIIHHNANHSYLRNSTETNNNNNQRSKIREYTLLIWISSLIIEELREVPYCNIS